MTDLDTQEPPQDVRQCVRDWAAEVRFRKNQLADARESLADALLVARSYGVTRKEMLDLSELSHGRVDNILHSHIRRTNAQEAQSEGM